MLAWLVCGGVFFGQLAKGTTKFTEGNVMCALRTAPFSSFSVRPPGTVVDRLPRPWHLRRRCVVLPLLFGYLGFA